MSTLTLQPRGYTVSFRDTAPIIVPTRSKWTAVVEHVNRHKTIYRIGALTITLFLAGEIAAFANPVIGEAVSGSPVGDGTGVDAGARKLYDRLLQIGRWIITIKGAFDTVSHTVQGDFVSARKSGLAYLMVYAILKGLPWAFDQVDGMTRGM
jgi:hypothetical protein